MKLNLLLATVALAAISILTGCAGSAVDRDFRSKVKSDTTDLQGSYDPETNSVGGELRNTIEFRDPNATR